MKLVFCSFNRSRMTDLTNVRNNFNFPQLNVKGVVTDLAPVTPGLSATTIVGAVNSAAKTYNGRVVRAFDYDADKVALFLLVESDVVAADIKVTSDGGAWTNNVCVDFSVLDGDWRIAPAGYISFEKAILLAGATALAVK